jgi:hypothetical protein
LQMTTFLQRTERDISLAPMDLIASVVNVKRNNNKAFITLICLSRETTYSDVLHIKKQHSLSNIPKTSF